MKIQENPWKKIFRKSLAQYGMKNSHFKKFWEKIPAEARGKILGFYAQLEPYENHENLSPKEFETYLSSKESWRRILQICPNEILFELFTEVLECNREKKINDELLKLGKEILLYASKIQKDKEGTQMRYFSSKD